MVLILLSIILSLYILFPYIAEHVQNEFNLIYTAKVPRGIPYTTNFSDCHFKPFKKISLGNKMVEIFQEITNENKKGGFRQNAAQTMSFQKIYIFITKLHILNN